MLVSVIIPCYNVENYISICLDSVIKQTYTNLEIICVDDGSTDKTLNEIKKFIASHSNYNIQLIIQENKGAPAARNKGVRHSKGKYIQFLDADDKLLPKKIEAQINLAINCDYPDLLVGSYSIVDNNEKLLVKKEYSTTATNLWLNLMDANLGNTCSNLFKSSLFERGISWNEELKSSQEYTLMFEILKVTSKIVFSSEVNTIIVRRTIGSISTLNKKENWKRYINLRIKILLHIVDNKIEANLNQYHQIIFGAIRSLYPYDPIQAIKYYEEYLPKDFSPEITAATTRNYLLIFKVFGFRLTEKIKSLIK